MDWSRFAFKPAIYRGHDVSGQARELIDQLRPTHWAKNIIVLVPLFTSGQLLEWQLWPPVVLAFVVFCLASSAGYQLNDIIDLEADRAHLQKRNRPLAAGRLSVRQASLLGIAAAIIATALAFSVDRYSALLIVGYLALSSLYSAILKRFVIIDVLTLALLYCFRIFAGAAVIGVTVSNWLFAFSLFFFLSLALMKRHTSILKNDVQATSQGLGYTNEDQTYLRLLGAVTAIVAMVLLALHIVDLAVVAEFDTPEYLWAVWIVMMYWLSRAWLLASRGELVEDIAVAAFSDPVSWIVGALVVVLFLLAS
jgi:4-hydroxybenzoate polyprenyltransferase